MILDINTQQPERTIILTTNFTEGSRNACRYALQLFGDEQVNYVLMHSYFEPLADHDGLYSADQLMEQNSMKKLQDEKEKFRQEFTHLDLDEMECVSQYGVLVSAINDTISQYEADYVVIGNKADFDLESRLLGYKTANFIRKIKGPVLAVPSHLKYTPVQEVTFASDMKNIKDMHVLDPALRLVKSSDAKLHILYVSNEEEVLVGQQAEAGLFLDNYFIEVPHEFHHSNNKFIMNGISSFVESSHSDLVIVLARKHNFFERLLKHSQTQLLSELAKVPMLVLHE
ncbi:MAG: universal stress protein [Crocinitomicaceae bacterium]|nr:universal stress protein [Crocinitomicaceae bacterium]